MAKLILKSPYLKPDANAEKYMNYIATRDGVEKLSGYMNYIATRPGAEKRGCHGLFGDSDTVDLNAAKAEIEGHSGRVWTHIISLKREDAARLGYDNAMAWRSLLRSHRNEIAAAMKIPPDHFRWYAAFHNEADHPHVHMMAWSSDPKEGYLSKRGIKTIKSKLTNDIFRHEMLNLYEQKSEQRDAVIDNARKQLQNLRKLSPALLDSTIPFMLTELGANLQKTKGQKKYGYLSKTRKADVDSIVERLMLQPELSEGYQSWESLHNAICEYYGETGQTDIPITQRKEFRPIQNAVIQAALELQQQQQNRQETAQTVIGLLSEITRLISDTPPAAPRRMAYIDRKRRQELYRKRQAQGLRGEMEEPQEIAPVQQM